MTLHPETLAALRVLAGYSRAELARRFGVSQGHISDLERGRKQARPQTIKKLAIALAVPTSALLNPPASDLRKVARLTSCELSVRLVVTCSAGTPGGWIVLGTTKGERQ